MARTLATVVGIVGLMAAAYLFVHRSTPALPAFGNDSHLDSALFGIAISVLSIMLLLNTRPRTEPDAGDSLSM
jgi:hypothetical protein